jgi:CHAT domain-containing protein
MRVMKPIVAIVVLALCSLTAACIKKEPKIAQKWPRAVKPRLASFSEWRPCPQVDCGPADVRPAQCSDVVLTAEHARRLLVTQPGCTDAAIKALQEIVLSHPEVTSDLAAAYYMRSQRENRPAELLQALDTVNEAPLSAEMLFNRALILETLGLRDAAIASWNEFLKEDRTPWAVEARQHRDALTKRVDGVTQWERNKVELANALRSGDRAAVARLIAPFQQTALRWLEEDPVAEVAAELSRTTKDRYPDDVADMSKRFPDAQRIFSSARRDLRRLKPDQAAAQYEKLIPMLVRAKSPLALTARLEHASQIAFKSYERSLPLLDPIEREARSRGYAQLAARIRATRGHFLFKLGRYVESLAEFDAALAEYRQLGNEEGVASTLLRRGGVYRTAGANLRAWRDLTEAFRLAHHLGTVKEQHNLFGEAAATAAALGHPQAALSYQNALIRLLPSRDLQFAIAVRNRAAIQMELGQEKLAAADLDTARSAQNSNDPTAQRILEARTSEISGRTLMKVNPAGAVAAFTRALAAASIEYPTFLASLHAQRAEAHWRSGRPDDAERDLIAAVAELDREQTRILSLRKRGQAEEIWSGYFSRFQNVYQGLIRQYIEQGGIEKALEIAEQARAVEPLNLAQTTADQWDLAALQRELLPGTFLLEYAVLEDRTIVWIVSHDRVQALTLEIPRTRVEQWSAAVQRGTENIAEFGTAIAAAYDGLVEKALATIGGKPERLVFIPDGAMHGLPLAALRDSRAGVYVIERAPVEIAGSARLYLLSLRRDAALRSSDDRSLLLVGDPTADLPHAKLEVTTIASGYAPNARTLMGSDATIDKFLHHASNSSIIHIAAHSVFDIEAPFRSFIRLAPSATDSGELYAHDLLTGFHGNQTRLVVLSSCSSAGGGPVGPEGVAPLVRPLIAEGVPAVIGSLWDVKDATAKTLLVSFHQHYRNGSDAAMALRNAQIAMLTKDKDAGVTSAVTWGAFQVIGHGSSPFAPPPQPKEKPP